MVSIRVLSLFASLSAVALIATGCTAPTHASSTVHPVPLSRVEVVFQYGGTIQTAHLGDAHGSPVAAGIDAGEQLHPRWSPDGSAIVFSADAPDGTHDIWIHKVAGNTTTKLFDCVAPCFWSDDPAFSPDGSTVAFGQVAQAPGQTGRDGTPHLITVKPDGSDVTVVATGPPIASFFIPSWSPDGAHIAIQYGTFATASVDDSDQLTGQIATVEVSSGTITMLDTGPGFADNPSWSPDGSRIAFQRKDPTTDWELYSIAPTGGRVTRITHQTEKGGRVLQPSWTVDGSLIAAVWEATPGPQNSKAALVDPASGEAVALSTFGATHVSVRP